MQYKLPILASLALANCIVFSSAAVAQTSIQVFSPVDVRLSQTGTGYNADAVVFNSSTLNLTCPANGITAVLSSSADGTGNIIVDNNINLTVTAGTTVTGPTNACVGGVVGSPVGPLQNCFNGTFESEAGSGTITGMDPDNYVANGGIAPLNIAGNLVSGPLQLKVDLVDQGSGNGFYLAGSSIYLNTNCTQGGVTGPALISGNPISSSNPTAEQLTQDFSFNPLVNQQIGFTYDLSEAEAATTLTVTDGTIPQVGDMPLDPSLFQSVYAPQTSFATSECLVHSGELLPSGQPACKLFTLECKVGTGATATGAQCPVSSQNNEFFKDAFDGPAFTLSDIVTPNGPTFHEGIGFLMANEGWTGGPCSFDPAANLQTLPCPQNLLTSFASGADVSGNARKAGPRAAVATSQKSALGPVAAATTPATTSTYASSGRTTHPNSTFLTVAQVPEDLTTVSVAGQSASGWVNTATPTVTLSSQPPALAGTTLPGAANFVASPILNISYGLSPSNAVPLPGSAGLDDTVLASGVTCPTQANPTGQPATVFTPDAVTLPSQADGTYLLHYYAQDCAGTEELKFTQDGNGNWSTGFYTYAINIDTTAPLFASGPTLSPAASSYAVGQVVTASYSCTDSLSGVVRCGATTYAQGVATTGTLTAAVDTSSPGSKTFTVLAVDAAGNQNSASVNYQVVSPYDSQIQFSITPTTVTYPQGATASVKILPLPAASAIKAGASRVTSATTVPSGTVQVLDGTRVLATLKLTSSGTATYNVTGLNAGSHSLSVSYSGDAHNPAGKSAPVSVTVAPGSVKLDAFCTDLTIAKGNDYVCAVYAQSNFGGAQGYITYSYDNSAPKSVPLFFGISLFTIPKPALGAHTVVISYPAQPNYTAAPSLTEHFTVTQPATKPR